MNRSLFVLWFCLVSSSANWADSRPPSLVFILADDLGYGELGCYGQRVIKTPRLDQMAREGLRFTQFYAGATVCAPSRCVLMTGKHLGRCHVRGNSRGPKQALRDTDITVAEVLRDAGYATALIGKWGLGDMTPGAAIGMPNRQGFDYFFGYANQHHAHNYYPVFLWRNEEMLGLPNVVQLTKDVTTGFHGGAATERNVYSHDLFAEQSLAWIREHYQQPFFLFLALTIPHANNEGSRLFQDGAEVPDYGLYTDKDWPNPDKGQAAMITRMDKDVGRILDMLNDLKIADNTLVIFSSDNGPHNEARHDPQRFQPSGALRGMKRDLYEGGIRVPTIAYWPGTVAAGTVSNHMGYFGDLMATACELSGQPVPDDLNSISFMPTLKGYSQPGHEYLYWEFYERGGRRAVRWKQWKAVRTLWHSPIELFDLSNDLSEKNDLSGQHPETVKRMAQFMGLAHEPSLNWPIPERK